MRNEGACPTIYGPVNSRRHGLSLGINLGLASAKVCTWGCLYCQCGFGERRDISYATEHAPTREAVRSGLLAELVRLGRVDSVTFAGNAEPSAHPQFAEIVDDVLQVREQLFGRWIVNCLSNGSELDDDRVVAACDRLDEAWIKLDCALDPLFQKLNRPLARVGGVSEQVRRIRRLARPRIQTLLWKDEFAERGFSNDTPENRAALVAAYAEIRPVEIHLTTISRGTASNGLVALTRDELEGFAAELSRAGLIARVYT